jgi:O-acetyl-ADP-ribose deacetylase (regulator of RNase III)
LILDTASKKFSFSENKKCADIGETILLPMYEGNNNILISAVTQDLPNIGIQANALGIITAVKNALSICSENRYSSITMPIIGTGHGGINHSISLALICLQYFVSLHYSQNHHVKELVIIVFDPYRRLERNIFLTVECIKKLISINSNGGKN